MMSTIRKNMAIILWILVFSFIGTIIFSWGMGGFKGKYESGVVGRVNNIKITDDQYRAAKENRFDYERQNSDQSPTESRSRQIRQEVWESLITDILLDDYRKKAGIIVSNEELAFAVRKMPPPSILNSPNFVDSSGQFNWTFYHQVLADPSAIDFVIYLEQTVRRQMLQRKTIDRITSAVHISDQDIRETYLRDRSSASVTYVSIPWRSMEVDSSTVTDAELREEYRKSREEFKTEETRKVEYVLFPEVPSPEDTLEAREIINEVIELLDTGGNFEELAAEYSEDPSATEGGDLGWFGKGRMVPRFEEAAFSTPPGTLAGPILSRFGFHLIRVDDHRGEGENMEVKARHILVKIERSQETLDDLRSRADGFRDEADENDFAEAASVYNVSIEEIEGITRTGFIPRFGRNQAASEFLFNRPKGEVSPVYRFRQGFAIMCVIEVVPQGVKPFEQAKPVMLNKLLRERKIEVAAQRAQVLHQAAVQRGSLEDAALALGYKLEKIEKPFRMSEYITGIGRDYYFTATAFSLDEGEFSRPVKGEKGYYLIRLDEKKVPDEEGFARARDRIVARLVGQRQQQVYENWLSEAKKAAKIEDFRYLYYTEY